MLEATKYLFFVGTFFGSIFLVPRILIWATNGSPRKPAVAERTERSSNVVDKAIETKLARRATNVASLTQPAAHEPASSAHGEVRDYSSLVDDEMQASAVE